MWFLFVLSLLQAPSVQYSVREIDEARAREALAEIKWDWRDAFPGLTIEFSGPREGYQGMYSHGTNKIDIWVTKSQTIREIAGVIVHELAHAFDETRPSLERRNFWIISRGFPRHADWQPPPEDPPLGDYGFVAGDFVECVRFTLLGPEAGFYSLIGDPPTEAQQAMLKEWLGIE